MTTSDDAFAKLANVTQALGEERTKNERLQFKNDDLVEQLNQATYQNRDLVRKIKLLQEQLRGEV